MAHSALGVMLIVSIVYSGSCCSLPVHWIKIVCTETSLIDLDIGTLSGSRAPLSASAARRANATARCGREALARFIDHLT
eukprot:6181778-Pleurochrysis_carterae.AAC.1